jgi:hypothetical protein
MNSLGKIRWVRVLVGGFLAEVSVIAIVIPVSLLFGQRTLAYTAVTASLVSCFLFAIWVGRGVSSRVVLHGALVGVVATLLYVGLTRGQPERPAYLVAHVLKILGATAGGFVAERRRNAMSTATADVP